MPASTRTRCSGVIFPKCISDAFKEMQAQFQAEKGEGADPDEYRAQNVVWGVQESRWEHLQGKAKQASIDELAAPIRDPIACNGRQSVVLSALRDTLLLKLRFGKIRVTESDTVSRRT